MHPVQAGGGTAAAFKWAFAPGGSELGRAPTATREIVTHEASVWIGGRSGRANGGEGSSVRQPGRLHQEGDQLYWNDFKIVLSDSLAGGSASAGDCVAISGSIKKGITVVERSAIQYERKDEILSAQDKALLHISWRGGCGVQNPAALSRLVLS